MQYACGRCSSATGKIFWYVGSLLAQERFPYSTGEECLLPMWCILIQQGRDSCIWEAFQFNKGGIIKRYSCTWEIFLFNKGGIITRYVLGMTLNCIHIFIVTGSFLYGCVIRPASQRFFIYSCICLRILIISYFAAFLGTNSLSVLMCRKAINQLHVILAHERYSYSTREGFCILGSGR